MKKRLILFTVVMVILAQGVFAADNWDDTVTPMGAEKGANADGSIPVWTGGITKPPDAYREGGFYPDPFADEKPLMMISADNWMQFQDKLTAGQKAMFEKYPDYMMPVYVTHRSGAYPEFVYDAVKNNSVVSRLIHNGNAVKGGSMTSPFPFPRSGLEAIWNHLLRYRGASVERTLSEVAVTSPNRYVNTIANESILFPCSIPGSTFDDPENILVYFKQSYSSPPRLAGTLFLVAESLDKVKNLRQVWLYNPGQRRVSRTPFAAYDSTPPTSEGLRTFDQYDMYNGAMDRYDWTLEGKKEIYIPYNSYRLADDKVDENKILGPHFLNPEYTRYELHRVWKVNAVLKKGQRHIYASRVFYFDEDSWQIVLSEEYDARGDLWRFSEGHVINFYNVPLILPAAEMHYDLKTGQYLAMSLQIEPTNYFADFHPKDFTPDTLRREGNR